MPCDHTRVHTRHALYVRVPSMHTARVTAVLTNAWFTAWRAAPDNKLEARVTMRFAAINIAVYGAICMPCSLFTTGLQQLDNIKEETARTEYVFSTLSL